VSGPHYLVTGHTGFKGAWLVMLLRARGHKVSGLALDPLPGALFAEARLDELLENDLRIDIRDGQAVREAVEAVQPDVVVHMAAQPLVRESYRIPVDTIMTNVVGTLNVLEAARMTDSVAAHLVVTTDKVYQNVGRAEGYGEHEPLGAADPYSTSKAMADLLAQSWARSFVGPQLAIARGGNVIGGGDVSADRLLPDLMRAFVDGKVAKLRYPYSVRPWQHVLDCLDGYLTITEALLDGRGAGEWNVGPSADSFVTVAEVADRAASCWGQTAAWESDDGAHPSEATLLSLDPSKIQRDLAWRSRLGFPQSVDWTVEWAKAVDSGENPRDVSFRQIDDYLGRVPSGD